jgi:SPP1 gp7 family putative phage head morphogenesis protein
MPKSYWEKRQELTYLAGEKKVSDYYRGLQKAFEQSRREIRKVINDFYMRYARENKVSFTDAQKLLSRMELGELQEYIDLVNESIGKYNLKLTNMSIKARITRYQALEKQIDAILQRLYALEYEYKGNELLKEVYTDAYYRTWYNIDRYHGFHQEFARVNPRTIDELIRYPFNGANFSSRIWKQKDHMLQVLTEDITTMLVQGKNPQTLVKDFAKRFNTKEYEAYRLLYTESSFIIEQGTLAAYKEDGVEKYQILATLDMKTSDICREQDGNIYETDKATVGVNYPPFHPFCRTTTVPHYEDVEDEGTRVARDPKTGKSYEVPADMNYKDWKKAFVDGGSKDGLQEIGKNDIINNLLFPKEIAGVKRGKMMTRDEANGGKPNPNFKKGNGYLTNCQSCVVTYEARLRGYDVQALPNTKGSMLDKLSRKVNIAWIDPVTGKHPDCIFDDTITNASRFAEFLEKVIEPDKRYTLEFLWTNRGRTAHIISVDRTADGILRLYDPQNGKTYIKQEVLEYLKQLKYSKILPPKILRIDDKQFNLDVVNYIMEGVRK